ncbi:hypothetical protein PR048_014178 [Dryococelus australis]|uniref:Uncharacterized protein n=1 Tax=Dryococelus australis TaxID=614101 RepID=A0ABQ9HDL0_9NEOP|nr:hypothetical protein PR048_014178 [Dryococelus australis]
MTAEMGKLTLLIPSYVDISIGTFREFNGQHARLHRPVYTRAAAVCSLAVAPENSECYTTSGSMGFATCFLVSASSSKLPNIFTTNVIIVKSKHFFREAVSSAVYTFRETQYAFIHIRYCILTGIRDHRPGYATFSAGVAGVDTLALTVCTAVTRDLGRTVTCSGLGPRSTKHEARSTKHSLRGLPSQPALGKYNANATGSVSSAPIDEHFINRLTNHAQFTQKGSAFTSGQQPMKERRRLQFIQCCEVFSLMSKTTRISPVPKHMSYHSDSDCILASVQVASRTRPSVACNVHFRSSLFMRTFAVNACDQAVTDSTEKIRLLWRTPEYSPPTTANRVYFRVVTSDFIMWKHDGRCCGSRFFSSYSHLSPTLHFVAAPCSPHFTLIAEDLNHYQRHENPAAVRLLASHQGEPGSIPCLVHSGFSRLGIVTEAPAGFLGFLPFPSPFHSGTSPYSPYLTLIGCQDLAVKNRPDLFAHSLSTRKSEVRLKYSNAGIQGIPEKTRQQTTSSGTIPTREKSGEVSPLVSVSRSLCKHPLTSTRNACVTEITEFTADPTASPRSGGGGAILDSSFQLQDLHSISGTATLFKIKPLENRLISITYCEGLSSPTLEGMQKEVASVAPLVPPFQMQQAVTERGNGGLTDNSPE